MPKRHPLQIVATLGPSSWDLAAELGKAGADTLRLNSSHMAAAELARRAAAVRKQLPDSPLVIDLQGAKMRLGLFVECPVRTGERIRFGYCGDEGVISLPHREIFGSIARGETLTCDDDRMRFRVESVGSNMLEAVSLTDGILRPRMGVNVLEHPIVLSDLSEDDLSCIQATAHLDHVAFAFSFMTDGSEAPWIRRRTPHCAVTGKVERREAAENTHAIARAVDTIWICRGDLGAQLGPAELARWVSAYNPRLEPCPVLMAGQVLEHLTSHAEATRSEVCHLFELVSRGYAGFVLSDETAIGTNPVRAVESLRSLLTSFE